MRVIVLFDTDNTESLGIACDDFGSPREFESHQIAANWIHHEMPRVVFKTVDLDDVTQQVA